MKREEQRHTNETPETNPDWRKLPRNRPDKDEKHLAYSVLIANGISREKAATMLGYSPKTARSIDRALKEKSLKLVLLSEQRIKKAHRVVDKCLAGKAFGDIESVKDSTALRAAEMILDRSDPKAHEIKPEAYNFIAINVDKYRMDAPFKPTDGLVDVTPDPKPRTDEDP